MLLTPPSLDAVLVDLLAVHHAYVAQTPIRHFVVATRLVGNVSAPDVYARLRALTAQGVLHDRVEGWRLAPERVHPAMLALVARGDLERFAVAIRSVRPIDGGGWGAAVGWDDGLREARVALYAGQWEEAGEALRRLSLPWPHLMPALDDPRWFASLPAPLQAQATMEVVHDGTQLLKPVAPWVARLEATPALDDIQHHVLVGRLLREGRFADAAARLEGRSSSQADVDRAWLGVLTGDVEGAVVGFEATLKAYLKRVGKRAKMFHDAPGLFFVVALLATGRRARAREVIALGEAAGPLATGYAALSHVAESLDKGEAATWPSRIREGAAVDPIEGLIVALGRRWLGVAPAPTLEASAQQLEAAGQGWLAGQLRACAPGGPPSTLTTLFERGDRAQRALARLEALVSPVAAPTTPAPATRLAWVVTIARWGVGLTAREQSRTRNGWSKGRAVAMKRLRGGDDLPPRSTADKVVCGLVTATAVGRYGDVAYDLAAAAGLDALIGADNVVTDDGERLVSVEVRRGACRLQVDRHGDGLRVALEPRPSDPSERLRVVTVSDTTLEVVAFSAAHHALAEILGPTPLDVGPADVARFEAILGGLADQVTVASDRASAPVVRLRRVDEGLRVELGIDGPRRPEAEAAAAALRVAVPLLPPVGGTLTLALPAARALVADLDAAGAPVAWTGDPWRVSSLGVEDLDLTLGAAGDGFTIDGTVGDVPIREMLDYLAASPGRLIGDDARVLALTAELRARLDELRALSDAGARLRYPGVRLPAVDAVLEGLGARADAAWKAMVARLTAVGEDPPVPSTLRAELRPYQIDGFRWLARLARWGVGGCLADDMGLGKTLQVLAVLLHRAGDGPALIVAPTSVTTMWTDQLATFAPTLRVRTIGSVAALDGLGALSPGEVVLTSYGLLAAGAEAFAGVRFATAVLDEAQAIKNPDTARARAACGLDAGLRIVTTGTPVENRLTDLWSLFKFLNPGLLGSARSFEAAYARPIEKQGDAAARARLRRLVSPLLLRRTKGEVLQELPPRTEVVLPIALSEAEVALYEAIRAETLARLAEAPGEQQRFVLLAAITKLRRAASHRKMVLPDAGPESSKLDALAELLDDILPRGHKALVFSQFVDHLTLARAAIEALGVKVQYLDGATPPAARKRAIDAFQAGDGDVFLISLKAGGTGLNLTAADYVIHLDPWWNPAAEDQASDRSHRLGQTRPVMVYRLVAQATVEDAIVALHHRKRELASGLLAGADAVGGMSEAELMALVRGG